MTLLIETLSQQTGELLKKRSLKLATAESCTGGGLSYWVTSIPGSSDWFERGFVTYSNAAKIDLLGVNPATLESEGAVSEAIAKEMAEGALRYSEADISIATTGIAGPTGGSETKPVGTVWMAWASPSFQTTALKNVYTGNRQDIRMRTMEQALQKLIELLS